MREAAKVSLALLGVAAARHVQTGALGRKLGGRPGKAGPFAAPARFIRCYVQVTKIESSLQSDPGCLYQPMARLSSKLTFPEKLSPHSLRCYEFLQIYVHVLWLGWATCELQSPCTTYTRLSSRSMH